MNYDTVELIGHPSKLNIMTDSPEMQLQLVSAHGMLAILEVLEGKCSRDVIMKLLQIINLVSFHCFICKVLVNGVILLAGYWRLGLFGKLLSDWVRRLCLLRGCHLFLFSQWYSCNDGFVVTS